MQLSLSDCVTTDILGLIVGYSRFHQDIGYYDKVWNSNFDSQAEQGGSNGSETNNSVEEINTASDGDVECGIYVRFQHLNNIGTPSAVPFETINQRRLMLVNPLSSSRLMQALRP